VGAADTIGFKRIRQRQWSAQIMLKLRSIGL
jgi:hypothetical protein